MQLPYLRMPVEATAISAQSGCMHLVHILVQWLGLLHCNAANLTPFSLTSRIAPRVSAVSPTGKRQKTVRMDQPLGFDVGTPMRFCSRWDARQVLESQAPMRDAWWLAGQKALSETLSADRELPFLPESFAVPASMWMRPLMQCRSASDCSWISLSIKCRKSPFHSTHSSSKNSMLVELLHQSYECWHRSSGCEHIRHHWENNPASVRVSKRIWSDTCCHHQFPQPGAISCCKDFIRAVTKHNEISPRSVGNFQGMPDGLGSPLWSESLVSQKVLYHDKNWRWFGPRSQCRFQSETQCHSRIKFWVLSIFNDAIVNKHHFRHCDKCGWAFRR